jgi:hypothetical protein
MAHGEDIAVFGTDIRREQADWKRSQGREPSRVRNARIWEALMGGLKQYKADKHFGSVQQDNLDNLIQTGVLEAENIKATEQYNLRKPWMDRAQEFGGVHDSRAEHIFEEEAWKRTRKGNEAFNALHPSEESYPTYSSFDRAFQNREIGEGLHTAMSKLYNAEKDDLIQFARSGKGYDPTTSSAYIAKLKEMQIDAGNPSLFGLMTGSARRQAKMQDKMIDTYRDDFVSKAVLNGAVDYQIFEKNRGQLEQMRVELKDTPLSWVDKVSDDVWEDLSTAPTSIRQGFYESMQGFIEDTEKTKGKPPTQKELHNQIYQFTIGLAQPSEGLKTRYWKLMADISSVEASKSSEEDKETKIKDLKANYEKDKGFFQAIGTSEDASKWLTERAASLQAIERIQSQLEELTAAKKEGNPEYNALETELYILTKSIDFKNIGMSDQLINSLIDTSLTSRNTEVLKAGRDATVADYRDDPGTYGGLWLDHIVFRKYNEERRGILTSKQGLTWHESSDLPLRDSTEGADNVIHVQGLVRNIVDEDLQNRLQDVNVFDLDTMYNNLIHTTENIVDANNARHNVRDYVLGAPFQLDAAMNVLLAATDENGNSLLNVRETATGQKIVQFGGRDTPNHGMIINTLRQYSASKTKQYQQVPYSNGLLEHGMVAIDPADPFGTKKRIIRISNSAIRDAKTSDDEEKTISRLTILQNRTAVANNLNEGLDLLEANNAPALIISDFKKAAELRWGVDSGEGWLEEDDEGRFRTYQEELEMATSDISLKNVEILQGEDRRLSALVDDMEPSDERKVLLEQRADIRKLTSLLEDLKNNERDIEERGEDYGLNIPGHRTATYRNRKRNILASIEKYLIDNPDIRTLLGRS